METEVQCEDPPPPDGAFFETYVREDILYNGLDMGALLEAAQVDELVQLNPYEDMEAEDGLVWGGSTYLTAEEETIDSEEMPQAVKRNALRGAGSDQDQDEDQVPLYDWEKGFLETAIEEACHPEA